MGTYATTTSLALVMYGVDFSATNMSTLASKAIDHAEAEIDKYLARRYDLSSNTFQTSSATPPIVQMLTERLAEGYLWRWISRGSKESIERSESLIDEVKKNLADISAGKADLIGSTGAKIDELSTGAFMVQCNTSNYSDTFGEDEETDWAVDPDKLDDIDTIRSS